MIKWDLSEECKDSSQYTNQSDTNTNWKIKIMIITIDAEKVFDKIQQIFMIKNPWKTGQRGNLPQHIQQTHTNIILNGENLKAFPLRSGTRQGCPLLLLLINIVWKS